MGSLPNIARVTAIAVTDVDEALAPAFQLSVNVPTQEKDEWCWCAVTVGICSFFDPSFALSQCQTASLVLGIADACTRPDDEDVNTTFALNVALAKFNHLKAKVETRLTFDQVRQQIDLRKPVCVRVLFDDGSAHVLVIRGYRVDANPMVATIDPRYGESIMPLSEFANNYQGSGTWKQSYLTT